MYYPNLTRELKVIIPSAPVLERLEPPIAYERPKRNKLWTMKEISFLKKLSIELGLSANKIFRQGFLPGRSLASINSQTNYIGLGNPIWKARMKNARHLSEEEKTKLTGFLSGEGRRMLNTDIARLFNFDIRVICYYRRKAGLLLSRSYILVHPEDFRHRHKLVMKALRRGLKRYHQRFRKTRRDKLIQLFRRLEAKGINKPILICKTCHSPWYATDTFFYRHRVGSDGKLHLYLHCKACGLPWEKRSKKLIERGEAREKLLASGV